MNLNLLCRSLAASYSPAGFAFFPFVMSDTDSEGSLSHSDIEVENEGLEDVLAHAKEPDGV